MADFTQTVTNTILVFGIEPTEKWGSMTWGTDKWAIGTEDLPVGVHKVLDNSQTSDSEQFKSASHQIDETVSFQSETVSEYLTDGSGYFYVFGTNTNADSRNAATWSELNYDTATFTTASRPTTVWV